MFDNDTHDAAAQQANALRASSRAKYASGAERLRMGEDALALLSFHGALADGLWAYLIEQGQPPQAWACVLEALRADGERPLSDEQAQVLEANYQLRTRIAQGEDVDLDRSEVAGYQQVAWQVLRTYGVSVDQRAARVPVERETPRRPEQATAAADDQGAGVSNRQGPPAKDWSDWREQAIDQVQRNRRLLVPVVAGLVVFLLLCVTLRSLFGGGGTPQSASATPRPTPPLSVPVGDATTPPPVGTSLANEQAALLPTASGAAPTAAVGQAPAAGPNAPTLGGLVIGGRAIVSTQGDPLNLRTQPSTGSSSSVIAALATGTSLEVLEGPTQAEGFTWWRVRAGQQEGWVVGDFLSAQAGP